MEQSNFRKLLNECKDDSDFKRKKAELEQEYDWISCQTDEEVIARYGQETYELAKKVVEAQDKRIALELKRSKNLWGRIQSWRTRKELKSALLCMDQAEIK